MTGTRLDRRSLPGRLRYLLARWCSGRRPLAVNPCRHRDVVPVDSIVTGEVLAWLCTGCGEQLAAGFEPPARFLSPPLFAHGGVTCRNAEAAAMALVLAGFDPAQARDAAGLSGSGGI